MDRPLTGRSILIVEDEPLIALDIMQAFEDEGAKVTTARNLKQAMLEVGDPTLCAAILDQGLSDGDSSAICRHMRERNIPFVAYSGYEPPDTACPDSTHIRKPADMSVLVAAVKGLLAARQTSK